MEKPLVNKSFVLEKYPGKGGWTYVAIPIIKQDKKNPFGWIRVKGSIDAYPILAYHLMPLGNDKLFLPVKAEIRKKIKKNVGDKVHIMLYIDHSPTAIPTELEEILAEDQKLYKVFINLTESEKKRYIDWIYGAKTEETKTNRIVRLIEELEKRPGK